MSKVLLWGLCVLSFASSVEGQTMYEYNQQEVTGSNEPRRFKVREEFEPEAMDLNAKKHNKVSDETEKFRNHFYDGEHQKALELLAQIKDQVTSGKLYTKQGEKASTQSREFKDFMGSEEVSLVEKAAQIRENIEEIIPTLSEWVSEEVTGPEGYRGILYYKDDGDSGKLQVVTEIHMPWTMEQIAALMYEADLTPKYIKASSRQKVTLSSNPAPYVCSFQNLIDFPWPLDDRWGNNKSIAFVGEDIDSITQSMYSHGNKEKKFLGYKVPKKPSGTTEILNHQTVRYFKKEGDKVVNFELSDVDLQSSTPQYLQNEMMKSQLPSELQNLMKNYEKIQPLYQERVEANQDHYQQVASWYGDI